MAQHRLQQERLVLLNHNFDFYIHDYYAVAHASVQLMKSEVYYLHFVLLTAWHHQLLPLPLLVEAVVAVAVVDAEVQLLQKALLLGNLVQSELKDVPVVVTFAAVQQLYRFLATSVLQQQKQQEDTLKKENQQQKTGLDDIDDYGSASAVAVDDVVVVVVAPVVAVVEVVRDEDL